MNATAVHRQLRVLLVYAMAALVAMTLPSLWFRIVYGSAAGSVLEKHNQIQEAVEVLRSECAHLGLVLNQTSSSDASNRNLEGIEASMSRAIREIEPLRTTGDELSSRIREVEDYFNQKLHPGLKELRVEGGGSTEARAAAKAIRDDFEILIGRLAAASRLFAQHRLSSVSTAWTSALAITLWLAVLSIPALVIQGIHLRKSLAAEKPAVVEAPIKQQASEVSTKRIKELEQTLADLELEKHRLEIALDAAKKAPPPPPDKKPKPLDAALTSLLAALGERANPTLTRDGRLGIVVNLTSEETKRVEPVVAEYNEPVQEAPPPTVEEEEELDKPVILLVDDDRLNRTIFKQVLTPEVDATIEEASSVMEAFEKLEKGVKPDLIVSDLVMPELDGFDFIQSLRSDERYKNIEIIMCTAHGDQENINRASDLGIHDYILKPFAKENVQRLVRNALQRGVGRPTAFLEAQRRLGLDEESYIQLAEMLNREVTETITFVRSAVMRGYRRAAFTRMNSLRGSSETVGDRGLADAVARVEKELESGEILFVTAELERLEDENRRLGKSVAHMRRAGGVPPVAAGGGFSDDSVLPESAHSEVAA